MNKKRIFKSFSYTKIQFVHDSLFPLPFTPDLGKELPVQVSLCVPFQSLDIMKILH